MSKQLTLGSLFSGSGGFELAGQLEGIKPIWNSEIAPFPIRVTTKRFPDVKHYGDISDMDGGKVEPVDVITFGSPCQDLSLAGRREGLDANGGNPSCNQGGIAVVEGNGSRPSHHGDGYKESDVMYTLNTVDRHAVAYALDRAAYNQGKNAKFNISINEDGTAQTVVAKGPGAVSAEPKYAVRRLTPLECCRLQGFPDFWCDDLGTENPTDAEIDYWSGVFETYNKALGKLTKAASRNRIIKWLENPYSDSAMYAMWGNGVALPCVRFVLAGIAAVQS